MRAFSDRFIALVCALGVFAALMTAARAGPYEDGLHRFTADSFDETIEGINAVATSGNVLAHLAPVRLNHRLRRIVEAALGGLTLMAPDPRKRLEAAQAVLKSKDANALPALEQAIAKEG